MPVKQWSLQDDRGCHRKEIGMMVIADREARAASHELPAARPAAGQYTVPFSTSFWTNPSTHPAYEGMISSTAKATADQWLRRILAWRTEIADDPLRVGRGKHEGRSTALK